MILKFLAQKSTSPLMALHYVNGTTSQGDEQRDEIKLIAGSPDDFLHVASSLSFAENFKSCVLAWSPGDAPDDEQLEQVLDDFMTIGFAGMDPNHFCYCVYLHRKRNKVDAHILVANVHLDSGKHFNIAPPKWMESFDPLVDVHNARWGWASPKDPKLARPIRPAFDGYGSVASTSTSTPRRLKDAMNFIQESMLALVMQGAIKHRASLLVALAAHGEIHRRQGKDFVSVVPRGLNQPIRLRGVIFREDFEPSMLASLAPAPRPARTHADHEADKDPVEEAAAQARFEAAVARRAIDNHKRYLAPRQRQSKKKLSVAASVVIDLPTMALAVQPIARTLMTSEPIHQAGMDVAGRSANRYADTALGHWTNYLKQPSPTYKDKHEQDVARALQGFSEQFGERVRQEFDRLARAIEELGRSAQALAGRLVRRRRAERAKSALERVERVAGRVRLKDRPENI